MVLIGLILRYLLGADAPLYHDIFHCLPGKCMCAIAEILSRCPKLLEEGGAGPNSFRVGKRVGRQNSNLLFIARGLGEFTVVAKVFGSCTSFMREIQGNRIASSIGRCENVRSSPLLCVLPESNAVLVRYVEGRSLSQVLRLGWVGISGRSLNVLLRRIGTWLRAFHDKAVDDMGGNSYELWMEVLDDLRHILGNLKGEMPESIYMAIRSLLHVVHSKSSFEFVPSHGDFGSENLLVSDRTVWVIDFESFGWAPRVLDILRFRASLEDAIGFFPSGRASLEAAFAEFLRGYGSFEVDSCVARLVSVSFMLKRLFFLRNKQEGCLRWAWHKYVRSRTRAQLNSLFMHTGEGSSLGLFDWWPLVGTDRVVEAAKS